MIIYVTISTLKQESENNVRDLKKEAEICLKELDKLNIPYGKIEGFTVNTRAKKRWGQCTKTSEGVFTIDISVRLLDENTPLISLKETLYHEILHTCNGCMNHAKQWKSYAKIVNDAYGCNIKRTTSASEMQVRDIVSTGKIYTKKAVNELISSYESRGGDFINIKDSLILCFGKNLKTSVITRYEQGYSVRMYNKTPKKYKYIIEHFKSIKKTDNY